MSLLIMCTTLDTNAQSSDLEIASIINKFQQKSRIGLDSKSIFISAGLQFLNIPYVGGTLEGINEELKINLKGQDCVTFVEYTLALACTNDVDSFKSFIANLRYNGKTIDGFGSRMHYLSQWQESLKRMKIYQNFSEVGNDSTTIAYSFMTNNLEYYPHIKDKGIFQKIKSEEKRLNAKKQVFRYFTFSDIDESKLNHGDIVAFLSKKQGLDFDHLGFVVVDAKGNRKLLHASLDFKKIMLSPVNIKLYLRMHKKFKGLVVIN